MIISLIFAALVLGIIAWIVTPELSDWARLTLAAAMTSILVVSVITTVEFLGWAKPVSLAWAERNIPEARVLGVSFREGESIFLWLQIENGDPRAYVMPWSQQSAEQLQQAMREGESNGTGVVMKQPFETSRDTSEPKFYAAPQPALSPKEVTPPAATVL